MTKKDSVMTKELPLEALTEMTKLCTVTTPIITDPRIYTQALSTALGNG